jgi:Icc-related predicted phosphoesterase
LRPSQTISSCLEGVEDQADVLIIAGDLTDSGLPAELKVLLEELAHVRLPIVAVLGNHDHENGMEEELTRMLRGSGILVLEGNAVEIGDVGFAGTKGFCGGFDGRMVQPFGEKAIKDFIQTGIDEVMRLENAVTKLDSRKKVGVLHYAPIKTTLEGESPELFAFLGSSRLGAALDRHGVDVIVHGHAHNGSPEGRTERNTPVYNVCRFVQQRKSQKPYCVFEL